MSEKGLKGIKLEQINTFYLRYVGLWLRLAMALSLEGEMA